ncbi:Glucose-signaling factor 2 [Spathaspora sp. JA1]|nr:Glucose-signaling factor 2 [Spathaspora sp. JA1]
MSDTTKEEQGYVDIYLRFNDDMEKDYCFQVKTTTTFKDLFKIFDTLPIALRPSVFYHAYPIGFKKSISPGYVTEDGNFLFDYESQKQTQHISDLNSRINDHVWPGQLIIPEWEFNDFGFYGFVSFLICWLYTDLPDFISPTPGICLTNQVTKIFAYLAIYFKQDKIAELFLDEGEPVAIVGQVIFFVFHIMKILMIFGLLYTGAFNPIKVFKLPGTRIPSPQDLTKDQLLELGWTGTRKATIDEYKDYYRDYKISEHGGMIQAHRAGLFDTMKHLGSELGEGEGYNTPLTRENMTVKLEQLLEQAKQPNFKLKLTYDYFAELGIVFAQNVENKSSSELPEFIKQYRRYGLLISNENLQAIVKARKGLEEKVEVVEEKVEVIEEKPEEENDN